MFAARRPEPEQWLRERGLRVLLASGVYAIHRRGMFIKGLPGLDVLCRSRGCCRGVSGVSDSQAWTMPGRSPREKTQGSQEVSVKS